MKHILKKIRNYFIKKLFKIFKVIVIQLRYDGLGDHLFHSHIPEIAKKLGYKKVFISNKNKYRNAEVENIVWRMNPFVDGFVNFSGLLVEDFEDVESNINLLDKIMLDYGLDDNIRFHEPKVYGDFNKRSCFNSLVVYDPNYISYVGKIDKNKIQNYLDKNHNGEDIYQMRLIKKSVPIDDFKKFITTPRLIDYCELIISCKSFYCLSSGGATLALALGVVPNVFWGTQKNMFKHSKNAIYIQA